MKTAQVVHWKHRSAPNGLRFFSSQHAAIQGGETLAELIVVGGFLCKWPAALGAPPDDATIATWEAEYDAQLDLEKKRIAAEAALREAQFTAALNDPNSPQEVKDYKAAKDK